MIMIGEIVQNHGKKIYVNSIHATFGYCTGFMVSVFVHVVHDENEMQCGYVQEKRMYSRSLIILKIVPKNKNFLLIQELW